MPAANHSFYLRNCYLENKLSKGQMVIDNEQLDLGNVTIPIYNLATREDHIAPAKSAFLGSKFFGGPVNYRARGLRPHRGRGQSAGQAAKYQYWTGDAPVGNLDRWLASATEHPGLLVAGLARMDQGSRTARPCRRASPAAASSSRSRTRREVT